MINEKLKDMEIDNSNYLNPKKECFNEDGTIDKYKYMLQFPNFTKHDKKRTKKKVFKFLDSHSREKYFRMEIQGTPYGVNFVFTDNQYIHTANQKEKFFKELWETIDSALWEVKNFDFNAKENNDSLEVWGTTQDGTATILFIYPHSQGTIEIGDAD